MHLTDKERAHLNELLKDYLADEKVQSMDGFIQHGNVTTLDHCQNVTRVSYWVNRRLKLGADEKALVTGALLHDFYLYDWHHQSWRNGLHGFTHPARACEKAKEHFHISAREQNIIRSHMWPLTLVHVPACREAVIVCCADKYCSLMETLTQRKKADPICW